MSRQEQQIEQLEREVEALRAALAEDLSSVAPRESAVARAKMAVRHELNEQWLQRRPQPEPSEAALARTRQAVREALAESGASPGARRWWMSRWAQGAVAAAATIALVVGYLASRDDAPTDPLQLASGDREVVTPTTPEDGEDVAAEVERYVAWLEALAGETTLVADTATTDMLDDRMEAMHVQLAWFTEDLSEEAELVQTLNEIMRDIDELLGEEAAAPQQGNSNVRREALG